VHFAFEALARSCVTRVPVIVGTGLQLPPAPAIPGGRDASPPDTEPASEPLLRPEEPPSSPPPLLLPDEPALDEELLPEDDELLEELELEDELEPPGLPESLELLDELGLRELDPFPGEIGVSLEEQPCPVATAIVSAPSETVWESLVIGAPTPDGDVDLRQSNRSNANQIESKTRARGRVVGISTIGAIGYASCGARRPSAIGSRGLADLLFRVCARNIRRHSRPRSTLRCRFGWVAIPRAISSVRGIARRFGIKMCGER
jgi:hypothetical protein